MEFQFYTMFKQWINDKRKTDSVTEAAKRILILGSGKIGSLIACLLSTDKSYKVYLADKTLAGISAPVYEVLSSRVSFVELDAEDPEALRDYVTANHIKTLLSGLPYHCNKLVADIAAQTNANYFDLTEDVEVTKHVAKVSAGSTQAFVPQCGLAPGYISIVTNSLIREFEKVNTVKMRVGALPVNPNNALKYSLTWSTDGLINEYGNLCYGIEGGVMATLLPLEGYETITIDGLLYEAFNTSGGLGSLAETNAGRVETMNYKTLRYPGHCKKIRLLMNDLKLNNDRGTLKRVLENAVPKTKQDVVVIYVAVSGIKDSDLFEENYVKKIYPRSIEGIDWSAIQVTTAAGICAVVDQVLTHTDRFSGLVKQEDLSHAEILTNQFGRYYAE